MTSGTCACGRPARPLAALLLAAPLLLGALGALATWIARATGHARAAAVGGAVAFALLAVGLLAFGLRVLRGASCAGCGRSLPR